MAGPKSNTAWGCLFAYESGSNRCLCETCQREREGKKKKLKAVVACLWPAHRHHLIRPACCLCMLFVNFHICSQTAPRLCKSVLCSCPPDSCCTSCTIHPAVVSESWQSEGIARGNAPLRPWPRPVTNKWTACWLQMGPARTAPWRQDNYTSQVSLEAERVVFLLRQAASHRALLASSGIN